MTAETAWKLAREVAAKCAIEHAARFALASQNERARGAQDVDVSIRALPMPPTFSAAVEAEMGEVVEMLHRLVNAAALSGVREQVAGWNGEGLETPYTERHPSRLGAQIKTNCGRIYDLDETMQAARALLSRMEGKP